MNQLNVRLLKDSFEKHYVAPIKQITELKRHNVYILETEKDRYLLKIFQEESTLRWQDRFLQQMTDKNTKGIVPFVHNRQGTSINNLPDRTGVFSIAPFIPGESIDFTNSRHVKDALKLLGHFHQKGAGIYGKYQVIPFKSRLKEKWEERLRAFTHSSSQTQTSVNRQDGLLHMVSAYGKEAIQWGEMALEYFPDAYMLFLEEQAQWERQIAHLDVAPHNFLVMDQKHYYIIDYDLVDYSPPLLDIVQYFNRILHYYEWSLDVVSELLEVYKVYYPVHSMQLKILPILLVYPNDFFREWLGLWRNHVGYHPAKAYEYFQGLEQTWGKRRRFVQKCLAMLK